MADFVKRVDNLLGAHDPEHVESAQSVERHQPLRSGGSSGNGSRIVGHRLARTKPPPESLFNLISFAEIDAHDLVLAASVKEAVGEGRVGAHLKGEDLRAGRGFEAG